MSEEKDKKKPTISDLEKLLENEPNDKVYIKPDGTIDVVNLTEQIKSLESRLKEAQEENKIWAEASKDWAVIGQRLSQAEAEKKKLQLDCLHAKLSDKCYCDILENGKCVTCFDNKSRENEHLVERQEERRKNWVKSLLDRQEEIKSLEARLSHLMDVAGKMAGALEDVVDADLLGGGLLKKVAISIAEWDGIKEKK